MRIFITGGCKNGKSTLARRLALSQRTDDGLFYIATMIPNGEEDEARVARHQAERSGDGFTTIERPRNIADLLRIIPAETEFSTHSNSSSPPARMAGETRFHRASLLLDSTTALLQNEMFRYGELDCDAQLRVAAQLLQVLDAAENVVVVSDFIFSDAMLYSKETELYRRGLAAVDRVVAGRCEAVVEVAYSGLILHKGELTL